jgi:glycerophosphoryl diester phosphodiesterase
MKTQFMFFLLTIIILGSSCKKDPLPYVVSNLEGDKIYAVGHGGMGSKSLKPMNSKESMLEAISYRPHGLEMDVQISYDGVPILFHDELLEHSTEGARGKISNVEYKDLKENRYKSINKERIISLSELIENIKHYPINLYVLDCKTYSDKPAHVYFTSYAYDLYKTIVALDIKNKVIIECSDVELAVAFKNIDKDLKISMYTNSFQKSYEYSIQYGLYGITIDMDLITKEQVKYAHQNGLRVSVFNADTEHKNHLAMTLSPEFIQTDKLKDLTTRLFNLYNK